MDIKTINTPEQLHQAIGKFLQSDYSHENLVETYNDALKCVVRFRVDYSLLPALPRKDDPLDGLQDVMDWCIKSSKVVDDIVFNLERQTISAAIGQFKNLKNIASRVLSLVNSKLREQAQNEAMAKVENEYKNLNEKASRLKVEEMLLTRRVDVVFELQQEQHKLMRRVTEDIVQIYLSTKDPTFKDKLSQLHDEEINKAIEALNKLVGSDTPAGKLLDIYCKLKDIPLQRQFNDVGYAYSLDDYTDMICGGCNRLHTSIDTVIKTFEEIQTKAEQKADLASTKKSQPAKGNEEEYEREIGYSSVEAFKELHDLIYSELESPSGLDIREAPLAAVRIRRKILENNPALDIPNVPTNSDPNNPMGYYTKLMDYCTDAQRVVDAASLPNNNLASPPTNIEGPFTEKKTSIFDKYFSNNFIKATIKHLPYVGSWLFDVIYGVDGVKEREEDTDFKNKKRTRKEYGHTGNDNINNSKKVSVTLFL